MLLKPCLRVVLLFLLLASLSFSKSIVQDLSDIALPMTFLIVVLVLIMLYMYSKSTMNPQLEAMVKLEIRELIMAAIIVIIVLSLFEGTDKFVSILTGEKDYMSVAKSHVASIQQTITNAYHDINAASYYLTLAAGYSYQYSLPLWYASTNLNGVPYAGLGTLILPVSQAAMGLGNSLYIYSAIVVLLDFFAFASRLLLPFALSLRVIPYTRNVGNTLIALLIGAYIIYPSSVIVVKYFNGLIDFPQPHLSESDKSTLEVHIPYGVGVICEEAIRTFTSLSEWGWVLIICLPYAAACGPGYAACFEVCHRIITNVAYPLAILIFEVTYGSYFLIDNLANTSDIAAIYSVMRTFLQSINELVVITYVDTMIIAIITIVGTKSISSILGGEYYLPGLQRLV